MPNHRIRSQFACCIFLSVHIFFSLVLFFFYILIVVVGCLSSSYIFFFMVFIFHAYANALCAFMSVCLCEYAWVCVCFSFSSKYILSCLLPCILFYLQFAFEYRRRLCCMDPIDKTYFVFYLRSLCLFVSHPHIVYTLTICQVYIRLTIPTIIR